MLADILKRCGRLNSATQNPAPCACAVVNVPVNTLVGVVIYCVGVRTVFGRSCKMTEGELLQLLFIYLSLPLTHPLSLSASTMQGCSSAVRVPSNSAVKRPSETSDGLQLPPAPPKVGANQLLKCKLPGLRWDSLQNCSIHTLHITFRLPPSILVSSWS